MSFFEKNKNFFAVTASAFVYLFFAYFLERTAFYKLSFLWILAFTAFYFLIKNNNIPFKNLAAIAILFRLIFLFSIPKLSQDFYRFIWDGRMILNGYNPYLSLPVTFIKQGINPVYKSDILHQGMGTLNGSNFTNYPPLNQFCFFIAALFANKSILGSVIVLRSLLIFADIGILYYGKKLLKQLQLPVKNIFWYVLNPFVIIEMTGNLHFESVMLFFLVVGLYKLHQQKWMIAAIFIAAAISVKLIPFLFLPLFLKWFVNPDKKRFLSIQKLMIFYSIIITTIVLFFIPFYASEFITNYTKSVALWFKKFEFNASFYYIFREIGYLFRGYNEIYIIGKITPILTVLYLLYLTLFKKNNSIQQLTTSMLFALSFYYFTATTVHPWYIATPLILGIFTNYKFAVIWSFVGILSYQAYHNEHFKENLWVVFIEYSILFSFLAMEIYQQHKLKKL